MTGREDAYRPSAIRALCRITDGGMLQAIERYMKQVKKYGPLISHFKSNTCVFKSSFNSLRIAIYYIIKSHPFCHLKISSSLL